jgi:hypothetical protein
LFETTQSQRHNSRRIGISPCQAQARNNGLPLLGNRSSSTRPGQPAGKKDRAVTCNESLQKYDARKTCNLTGFRPHFAEQQMQRRNQPGVCGLKACETGPVEHFRAAKISPSKFQGGSIDMLLRKKRNQRTCTALCLDKTQTTSCRPSLIRRVSEYTLRGITNDSKAICLHVLPRTDFTQGSRKDPSD